MNPLCDDDAGAAAERDGEGIGGAALEPEASSAMIRRIEARISSMLGSALGSNLDIHPYLLATADAHAQGTRLLWGSAIVARHPSRPAPPAFDIKYGGRLHKNRNDPNTSYPRSAALSRRRRDAIISSRPKTSQKTCDRYKRRSPPFTLIDHHSAERQYARDGHRRA